jgi:hypothetical protein
VARLRRAPRSTLAPPRARARRAKALRSAAVRRSRLAPLALALLAACLWRGYGDILRVHLDVLSGLADKAASKAAAGHRPSSNDVTELAYPLQRARQFLDQYRGEAERGSYQRFAAALERYQAFVEAIDAARGDPERWRAARDQLRDRHAAWRAAADRVAAALDAEG